ncbi:MAG: glycosyltransferase family 4 protein [Desulfobacteraceae bacterium]|nr:glycosyltransferase family 4 protein [Desulfobacteraceae bacterium]
MKIAVTHPRQSWLGGTERYLNHLSAYLAEKGHRVTIICRHHESPPHPDVNFITLKPVGIGVGHRNWRWAKAVERNVAEKEYDVVIGLGRTWSQDIYRLGGGCHRSYYEMVHRVMNHKIKQFLTLSIIKHTLYNAIEKKALSTLFDQKIVCNSKMVKADIQARYRIPESHISVIYNGVDLEHFHPGHRNGKGLKLRRKCGFKDDEFVILFLGNGYKRKGLDLLLPAFRTISKNRPDARLLVVGRDKNINWYKSLGRNLNIQDRTIFIGKQKDVAACYNAADLYVLPTRYDPFANSTLEAMACGLPAVTTRRNGASELIVEGIHGSVIGIDEAELVRQLHYWSVNGRAETAGVNARQLSEKHGIETKMADFYHLIEETCKTKSRWKHNLN